MFSNTESSTLSFKDLVSCTVFHALNIKSKRDVGFDIGNAIRFIKVFVAEEEEETIV